MKKTDCRYNTGVKCSERKEYVEKFGCEPVNMCFNCGWNPAEAAERIYRIKEKMRKKNG